MRISDWSSDVCSSDLSSLPPGNSHSPAIASPSGRCWTSSRPSRSTRAAATTTSDVFGSFPGISADKLLTFLCEWGHPRELYFSQGRSEEHTSELQSLMRISYAVFCLKKKKIHTTNKST